MRHYYRAAIWAPLALTVILWLGTKAFGYPIWSSLATVVVMLMFLAQYGGIPYVTVAVWATWRARSLDEASIQRMAWTVPALILMVFLPFAFVIGALIGDVSTGFAFFAIGAVYILAAGYLYVAFVLMLRQAWQRRQERRSVVSAV